SHESFDHIAGSVRIKIAYNFLDEFIVDRKIAYAILRLLPFREVDNHLAVGFVTARPCGIDYRRGAQRHVPGKGKDRKFSGLAARHRPAAKALLAYAYAPRRRRARHVIGHQI